MKTLKYLSLSILVLATLTRTVPAQQPGMDNSQQMPAMHCMGGMGMQSSQNSMAGPMKHDHENMMSLRQSADHLRQDLANARQSNDPA